MPRVRTVPALEDVEFCSFCGSGLKPDQATMFVLSWPPSIALGKRYTAGRWFACDDCHGQVEGAIQALTVSIRTANERRWRERNKVLYEAELEDRVLRANHGNRGPHE